MQFLEHIKSFEEVEKKIGMDKFQMPVIDPSIKLLLIDNLLDILWLKDGNFNRKEKDSFYVPAILAIFGWKAEVYGEDSY